MNFLHLILIVYFVTILFLCHWIFPAINFTDFQDFPWPAKKITHFPCLMDFEGKSVKAGSVTVLIICNGSDSVECGRISLAETVTVPGLHEMLIPARIGVVSDKVTGITEPSPGFANKHSLMLARVVAERGSGTREDDQPFSSHCGPVPRHYPGNLYSVRREWCHCNTAAPASSYHAETTKLAELSEEASHEAVQLERHRA